MVKPSYIGSVASRALVYLSSSPLTPRADQATYKVNTIEAIKSIQGWYNRDTGLWETTGWWNSANVLTMLANFAALDADQANALRLGDIFFNTYNEAQKAEAEVTKALEESTGLVMSTYHVHTPGVGDDEGMRALGFPNFLNNFYDDEGWWALALIRLYDTTRHEPYLASAASIFDDMRGTGVDDKCGGGIWWSKERNYKNAIANSLYLNVAAALANRFGDRAAYLGVANGEWEWFRNSGMINPTSGLVNDGLDIRPDGSCVNNNGQTWTYNQGALMSALAELSAARGVDVELLRIASDIADKAIGALQEGGRGILREPCEPSCGGDGDQFKGVFMRGLERLYREIGRQEGVSEEARADFAARRGRWREYVLRNADSVWGNARLGNNSFGLVWGGPPGAGGNTAATSSSAMEALVAAIAMA